MAWLQTFEKFYNENKDLLSEWTRIENQSGVYSEVQIALSNMAAEKCLTIHVYITTGVLLVKGSLWKQWAVSEFDIFLKFIALHDRKQDEEEREETDAIHPPSKEFVESPSQSNMKKDQQGRVANHVKVLSLLKEQV
eukprot:Seg10187.1 transcript_id=Seg10187.1/GoldUCD/mRNA.D3Y31 product="hypothetical protein" protein_id=Seg10187.1/GoldUCD/D3Y31